MSTKPGAVPVHYARTSSESLLSIFLTHEEWSEHPERFHITPAGASVTSGISPDDYSLLGDVKYGVGSDTMALLYTYHYQGKGEEHLMGWLKHLIHHQNRTVLGSVVIFSPEFAFPRG